MPAFLLLLVLAGVVEISVLIVVGQAIGVLPTLGLLLASAAIGVWLVRREGRRTLREFSEAARTQRPPNRELADGVLIAAGGILVLLPGFVSDLAGLLCLFPPTRAMMRGRLQRSAERRSARLEDEMRARAQHVYGTARTRPPQQGDVIDGEVVSVDEDDDQASDHQRGELPHDPSAPSEGPSSEQDRRSNS